MRRRFTQGTRLGMLVALRVKGRFNGSHVLPENDATCTDRKGVALAGSFLQYGRCVAPGGCVTSRDCGEFQTYCDADPQGVCPHGYAFQSLDPGDEGDEGIRDGSVRPCQRDAA